MYADSMNNLAQYEPLQVVSGHSLPSASPLQAIALLRHSRCNLEAAHSRVIYRTRAVVNEESELRLSCGADG